MTFFVWMTAIRSMYSVVKGEVRVQVKAGNAMRLCCCLYYFYIIGKSVTREVFLGCIVPSVAVSPMLTAEVVSYAVMRVGGNDKRCFARSLLCNETANGINCVSKVFIGVTEEPLIAPEVVVRTAENNGNLGTFDKSQP